MSGMLAFRKLVRREVRKAIGVRRVHRIRIVAGTITNGADTNFNLLTCDDDPNYDLTTDGTNVAECEPGSRIIAVQLVAAFRNLNTDQLVEYVIGRDPDQAIGAANYTIANLYAADVSAQNLALRRNIWAAGSVIGTTQNESVPIRIRVGKAIKRSRVMHDGDAIRLSITMSSVTNDAALYLRGRIITRSS